MCLNGNKLPLTAGLLVEAGRRVDAKSVDGDFKTEFYLEAERHAAYQANHGKQSHDYFINRYKRLMKLYPELYVIKEICCESWPHQTYIQAAKDAFKVSWPASRGHWVIAVNKCDYFGCAMVKGKNGIIYTTMIVGYLK
jgi:hypothetical protein